MKAQEDYIPWHALELHLAALRDAVSRDDEISIKAVLVECVHGYGSPK